MCRETMPFDFLDRHGLKEVCQGVNLVLECFRNFFQTTRSYTYSLLILITPAGGLVNGESEGYQKGVFYQTSCVTSSGLKKISEAFQNLKDILADFLETMSIQKIKRHGLTTLCSECIITNVRRW